MHRSFFKFPLASLIVLAASASAQNPPAAATSTLGVQSADPLLQTAEVMPLAEHSLLLDLARSGERLVAVGERGHVLMSSDGKTWTQSANVPVRSALTAVSAVGADVWAVGFDGIILHSGNAGETWEIQRRDPRGAAIAAAGDEIRQGAPLLDVLFSDPKHGIAIGAYSLLLTTSDGGKTWNGSRMVMAGGAAAETPQAPADAAADDAQAAEENDSAVFSEEELEIAMEDDPHLNAIARTASGDYVIVGERGAYFHSSDQGQTWTGGQLPYDGSMFGIIGFEGQHVLAFGLRGHVFESRDLGANWDEVATGTELSLMGGVAMDNGGAVIVGANGVLLKRASASEPLAASTFNEAGVIAGVLPATDNNDLLIVSENGIRRIQPK